MDRTGETGRVSQFKRSQPGEMRGADQQSIQSPQLALQGLGQFGIVIGAGAFQVQRVQKRFRTDRLTWA